jgi:hypothetical protein
MLEPRTSRSDDDPTDATASATAEPVPDQGSALQWRFLRVRARLAEIERLRRQICALQAQQAKEVAGYIDDQLVYDEQARVSDSPGAYRSMCAEVALATGVSVITAQGLMADCWDLVAHNPATLERLQAGDLQFWVARAITSETGLIEDPRLRALADTVIAEEAVDVVPGKARALAERRVVEVDPDAAARRSEQARREQHVTATPAGPGTATLKAFMESERVAACHDALRREAKARKATGSSGGKRLGELMCDVLFERVTGAAHVGEVNAQVSVVMTDTALFGLDDTPANLIGFGPLPAHAARLIAATKNAWLRRFYTDPVDGSVVLADTGRRCFDGALAEVIKIRDQYCRGISCASPISALDHLLEHAAGGPTSFGNGQGLSTNCHTTREHPQMEVRKDDETGVVTWTTPSGNTFRSLPPPALGHGSLNAAQRELRRMLLHPPDSIGEQALLRTVVRHVRRQHRGAQLHASVDIEAHRHRSPDKRPGRGDTINDQGPPPIRTTVDATAAPEQHTPEDEPPPF